MTGENKTKKINVQLWNRIAISAGVFSFVICILLIANYLQFNKLDPINTEAVNILVERLNENPADENLRQEIRAFDLLVRKAYFTNQWQIRTGGYLLLIGVAIVIIAMQILSSARKIQPVISDDQGTDYLLSQKNTRKWITIGGSGIVIISLFFAFLAHNKLSDTFTNAAIESDPGVEISQKAKPDPEKQPKEVVTNSQNETKDVSQTPTDPVSKESIVSSDSLSTQSETTKKSISEITDDPELPEKNDVPDNFPAFRGNGGNGIAFQKNIPINWDGSSGDNILWKTPVPGKGYNSPVIWGDKLFFSTASATEREVFCYDRHNGKLLWKATVDNIKGSPAEAPKVTDSGHAAPTMTTDGERVYAIFSNGDVIGFDMDGNRVWARNLGVPDNHYGHSSSLIMYNDILIIQYDHFISKSVMGLSGKTGETMWETKRDVKISWASPVLVNTGNRYEVMLVSDPSVASYDPETGKELWSIDCIFGEVGPSVAYSDGIVFALNEYATMVAIKLGKQPEILWEDDEYLSDIPTPVATDKYLFVPTSYGVVACYDTKTGEKYWEQDFDNGFYSSPIIVEDRVYLLDREGVMRIFKVEKEYISVGEPELGESTVTTPAFADGRIYIKGSRNLYCIGK